MKTKSKLTKIAHRLARPLGAMLLSAVMLSGGGAAVAGDWDYQDPILSVQYDDIINFNGGNTLTINNGTNAVRLGNASPFEIYTDADKLVGPVDRDDILHVNITGTGGNVVWGNSVTDVWTIQSGGSFTVASGVNFRIGLRDGADGIFNGNANSTASFGGNFALGGEGSQGVSGGNGGDGGIGGLANKGTMTFNRAVTLGGNGGNGDAGGDGGIGGEGGLTDNGTMTFNGDVTLGGNGGNGDAGGNGGKGGLGLLVGNGAMTFNGAVTIGGNGGNGGSGGVDGDGGTGALDMSNHSASLLFKDNVTIGGTGNNAGNGTVTIVYGTVIMAGDNTMTVRGNGSFQTVDGTLQSGTGVEIEAATIKVNNATTLAFDLDNADTTTTNLTLTGTVSGLIGGGTIDILLSDGNTLDTGTYHLVYNNGTSFGAGTLKLNGSTDSADDRRIKAMSLNVSTPGYLDLKVGTLTNTTLTWTGDESNVWENLVDGKSPHNWTDDPDFTATVTQFVNGDTVIFDADGANRDITVGDAGVKVDGMTILDDGYTFTGGKITGTGNLAVEGDTTFGSKVGFTGEVTVDDGVALTIAFGDDQLKAKSLTFGEDATITVNTTAIDVGQTVTAKRLITVTDKNAPLDEEFLRASAIIKAIWQNYYAIKSFMPINFMKRF